MTAYATPEEYSEWWGNYQYKIDLDDLTTEEITALENQLEMAAGDILVALNTAGAADCTLSEGGLSFLKKINILSTAVIYHAPCGPKLSDEERQNWLTWIDNQLIAIREGKIELCDGYTGKDFPAMGIAQQAWTEFQSSQLIINRARRRRG